jgi:hypothetical protein
MTSATTAVPGELGLGLGSRSAKIRQEQRAAREGAPRGDQSIAAGDQPLRGRALPGLGPCSSLTMRM